MSKKTRQKAKQQRPESPAPVAPQAVPPSPSFKSLWRRHGLLIAAGCFILSNLALRLVDTKVLEPTAFPLIVVLTFGSVGLAGVYGLQQLQVSRRSRLEGWSKADWERWRNGEK